MVSLQIKDDDSVDLADLDRFETTLSKQSVSSFTESFTITDGQSLIKRLRGSRTVIKRSDIIFIRMPSELLQQESDVVL